MGGQGDLLHTVTTLAGVNNGTTMASTLMENGGYEKVMKAVCYGVGTIGNMGFMTHFWDQRLDQWGITANPEDKPHFIHIAKPDELADLSAYLDASSATTDDSDSPNPDIMQS